MGLRVVMLTCSPAHHTPVRNSSDTRTPVSVVRNQLSPFRTVLVPLCFYCVFEVGVLFLQFIHRNPGFPRGLFPVFFMLGATIMTETSSHHMTIPSRFIHLDDFCNWADLALPVEMIISLSLPFGVTLYHLVSPCIIRTAFMSAAAI